MHILKLIKCLAFTSVHKYLPYRVQKCFNFLSQLKKIYFKVQSLYEINKKRQLCFHTRELENALSKEPSGRV